MLHPAPAPGHPPQALDERSLFIESIGLFRRRVFALSTGVHIQSPDAIPSTWRASCSIRSHPWNGSGTAAGLIAAPHRGNPKLTPRTTDEHDVNTDALKGGDHLKGHPFDCRASLTPSR
jgi:hypothetical protein